MLARFRLVIDNSHDRLYAIPNNDAPTVPFVKDRLGLTLGRKDANLVVVYFVAPGSPAQAAGFEAGDTITRIDLTPTGQKKSVQAWPTSGSLSTALLHASAGTVAEFTLDGGRVHRMTLADFF
jgi:C-terminal processing protease CtpA/Prc